MKKSVSLVIMSGLALFLSVPLGAHETRVRGGETPPPSATIGELDWLVGQWTGSGIGGAPAHESWLPPVGGTMVGTFIQEDGESGIRFSEHMYLMEEDGTLMMRLKHFNADLTSWEEKDDTTDFTLIAVEECAAYFNSLTLKCAKTDSGADGLLVAVRMQSGDELIFRFNRAP